METYTRINMPYSRYVLILTGSNGSDDFLPVVNDVRQLIKENVPDGLSVAEYASGVWEFGYGVDETDMEYIAQLITDSYPCVSFTVVCLDLSNPTGARVVDFSCYAGDSYKNSAYGIPCIDSCAQ